MSASPLQVLGRTAGLVVLAGLLGTGIGVVHRWYAADRIPEGLAVLVGLSGVAVSLNTTIALGEVIGGDLGALGLKSALLNVATFVAAALAASAGARAGDHLGSSVATLSSGRTGERVGEVSAMVRSAGRVITVDLPDDVEDIGDIDGYDPVDPDVKAKLAGKTLVFPRRLTVGELHDRFVTRLKTDYAVGHVDVELTDTGEVTYLALGSREAGLGPTLPPQTAALAVRADPAPAVSPGDVVQVWGTTGEPDELAPGPAGGSANGPAGGSANGPAGDAETPGPELVTTAEIRGSSGDVVTLVVDAAETGRLDPEGRYRLVTLPVEPRADREFASVLRAAEETMGVITIAEGSPLAGAPVGGLDVAVVAVRGAGTAVETIPSRSRVLTAGETVYVVARPEVLRRLEDAATPPTGGGPVDD